jgi:hypothetical protein
VVSNCTGAQTYRWTGNRQLGSMVRYGTDIPHPPTNPIPSRLIHAHSAPRYFLRSRLRASQSAQPNPRTSTSTTTSTSAQPGTVYTHTPHVARRLHGAHASGAGAKAGRVTPSVGVDVDVGGRGSPRRGRFGSARGCWVSVVGGLFFWWLGGKLLKGDAWVRRRWGL